MNSSLIMIYFTPKVIFVKRFNPCYAVDKPADPMSIRYAPGLWALVVGLRPPQPPGGYRLQNNKNLRDIL